MASCKKKAKTLDTTAPPFKRVCYICKTTFWIKEEEQEEEEPQQDNSVEDADEEKPTTLANLKPIAKRGLDELCLHFGTVLEQNPKTVGNENGSLPPLPLVEAFCVPCVRHLAHVGRMSEDMDILKRAKHTKMEGLGQLMAITRRTRRRSTPPTPKSRKKRVLKPRPHTRENDADSDTSLEGDATIWSNFRNEVINCYKHTDIDAILKQGQEDNEKCHPVHLDLTSSSEDEEDQDDTDNVSTSTSTPEESEASDVQTIP